MVHDALQEFHPVRLHDSVPPETVAVELDGALFNCARDVALLCAYLTPATTPACAALRSALGMTQLEALKAYILKLRKDYEVILTGDLDGWTGCDAGWDGEDAAFTDIPYLEGERISECSRTVGPRGGELLRLARAAELRF